MGYRFVRPRRAERRIQSDSYFAGPWGILVFVGVKMLVSEFYHIPVVAALGVIVGILLLAILASIIWPRKEEAELTATAPAEGAESKPARQGK